MAKKVLIGLAAAAAILIGVFRRRDGRRRASERGHRRRGETAPGAADEPADVKLGDTSVQEFLQSDVGDRLMKDRRRGRSSRRRGPVGAGRRQLREALCERRVQGGWPAAVEALADGECVPHRERRAPPCTAPTQVLAALANSRVGRRWSKRECWLHPAQARPGPVQAAKQTPRMQRYRDKASGRGRKRRPRAGARDTPPGAAGRPKATGPSTAAR